MAKVGPKPIQSPQNLDTTGMKDIFSGLDAMNPKDSFASFNVDHIMTFAEQYKGD
jgi:hypothetical protein